MVNSACETLPGSWVSLQSSDKLREIVASLDSEPLGIEENLGSDELPATGARSGCDDPSDVAESYEYCEIRGVEANLHCGEPCEVGQNSDPWGVEVGLEPWEFEVS